MASVRLIGITEHMRSRAQSLKIFLRDWHVGFK